MPDCPTFKKPMDPRTNYLKNTATDSKDDFVRLLSQVELFNKLPRALLERIFEYAKFVTLSHGDEPVRQGLFDQEVFLLIGGRLEVFIGPKTDEKMIDILEAPFTLFGERCILGQPRGASIRSAGEGLLLGLDLSSLPDLNDHLENPSEREPDEDYQQNLDMYLIFASVLIERLDRLVRDQYKLIHKIKGVRKTSSIWKHNVLMTRLFNQFASGGMEPELLKRQTWTRLTRWPQDPKLQAVLAEDLIDTRLLYHELIRMKALGIIEELDPLVYRLISRLADAAQFLPAYYEPLQVEKAMLPPLIPLSDCLSDLFFELQKSGILQKPLSISDFFDALMAGPLWSPAKLAAELAKKGHLSGVFGQAHLMLFFCGQLIEMVSRANRIIGDYVAHLANYHASPRQFQGHHGQELATEFQVFFKKLSDRPSSDQAPKPGGVNDLLAQFGM
ncbi:MAG: hypothetical protein A2527_02365 [Candidatus Lambdaproteobacteria bacterium RIFOXYD2_FULL_50_16]|uniref:Cyclic nucleotide-binding domain-containing protein n=1 Tax=Candidatus Lambdaproteobacteria bacterium RIFOXYD2_FULL_50_16 TaxID=1817772 RepID=A0A1F6GDY4_9PROT|nr:MAG: hypothetical protein A2527_02365 [Candidatus Lambdaproteobacteria bacterium RIFOXYD2_FULL_50_16]